MKIRWKNRIAEGLALLLALCLLTGCGGSPAANTGDNAEKAANQETEQPAEQPAAEPEKKSGGANADDSADNGATGDEIPAPPRERPAVSASEEIPVFMEEDAERDEIVIGCVWADLSNVAWATAYEGIQERAAERNIKILSNDAKRDPGAQVNAIDNYVTSGVDAIVLQTIDPASVRDAVANARENGVYVIAIGSDIYEYDVCVNVDQYELGYQIGTMVADWINENLDGKAEVAVGDYRIMPDILKRSEGMIKAVNDLCPDAKIVAEETIGVTSEGVDWGENLLQSNPDIDVVMGINDSGMLGVYEAFSAAGHTGDGIAIFGCDASEEGLKLIGEGTSFRGTVDMKYKDQGTWFVDIAIALATGKDVESYYYCDMISVTEANIADYK
mgnify:FL=1